MARLSSSLLSKFGAPKLGELTECGVPSLDESPSYLGSFVLNSIFVFELREPLARMVLMFGRRVDHAVREYRTGRELLVSYVEGLSEKNNHFLQAMRAITHFEHCISSVCQASGFITRINAILDPATFGEKDDRVVRLKKMWNRSKHFDEDLEEPSLPSAEITAPIWVTNQGLESTSASVTFEELHSMMVDLLSALRFFAEELPRQIVEDRKAASSAGELPSKE